jgi:hypothetical protein
LSLGFTWLLRFKRESREQPILEIDCSEVLGYALWENSANEIVFISRNHEQNLIFDWNATFAKINANFTKSDENQFIDFAVTTPSFDDQISFFYKNDIVPDSEIDSNFDNSTSIEYFDRVRFGFSLQRPTVFSGFLKLVAFANKKMNEWEMKNFFKLFNQI